MPDKTPDEIWQETGDALAELERIGMEQIKSEPPGLIRQFSYPTEDTVIVYSAGESKTPAATIEGVELCERVALGMKWTQKYGYGMSVFVDASGFDRGIPPHNFERVGIARDRFFRPDLDGNHLAEVKAECDRRNWPYSSGVTDHGVTGGLWTWAQITYNYPKVIDTCGSVPEAVSFLRAFVAACEATQSQSKGTAP